jgi:hypothetical protein
MITWHHQEPLFRVGNARNLTIAVWFDAPTVARLQRMHEVVRTQRQSYPAGVGFLNLIVDGTPLFSPEARAEAAKITADAAPCDVATAHVVALPGMRGVATRTFLSTIFLIGRPKTPTKVFDALGSAAPWLAPLLSCGEQRWSVEDVVALEGPATARA